MASTQWQVRELYCPTTCIYMGDLCKESNVGAWFEEKCINVDFDELSVYDLWQNEGKNYFGWASMFAGKWVIM